MAEQPPPAEARRVRVPAPPIDPTTTPYRPARLGLVDRSEQIGFRWNGRQAFGFLGDTLASALMASGALIAGRSPILSRRRGLDAMGPGQSGCRVLLRRRSGARSFLVDPAAIELAPGLDIQDPTPRRAIAAHSLAPFTGDEDCVNRICDVLVVGAGPAGLEAARILAEAGRDVLMIDRDFRPGGRLLSDPVSLEGLSGPDWTADRIARIVRAGGNLLPRCALRGVFADGAAWATEHLPGYPAPSRRIWRIGFAHLILATGGSEEQTVFDRNDLPGVMSASALRSAFFRYGVLPGARIAIATADDSGYLGVREMLHAGAQLTLLDMRQAGEARRAAGGAGVAHRTGTGPLKAIGRTKLSAIKLARREGAGWSDSRERIDADILAVAGGWSADDRILRACGLERDGDALSGSIAQRTQLAGALTGAQTPDDCIRSGAIAAAGLLGRPCAAEQPKPALEPIPPILAPGARVTAFTAREEDRTFDPAAVPLRETLEKAPEELLSQRFDTSAELRVPAYGALRRLGVAAPLQAEWMRPQIGFAPGGATIDSPRREAAAARTSLALADLSAFGKIAVEGPDAAAFLGRVCVQPIETLATGAARPTLLLDDQGRALAEAVAMRLEPTRFLVTAATEHAAPLHGWLSTLLQTRWPELRVALRAEDDLHAAFALIGPLSRRALGRLVQGVELHDAAFPLGGVRTCRIGDVACRIARLSRAGELAYEIYAPASAGEALFDALWDVAHIMNGVVCGAEAQEILRVERGRIGAGEFDERAMLSDFGAEFAPSSAHAFVGGAMAAAELEARQSRPQLVGLRPEDPRAALAPGWTLRQARARGPRLGWITSAAWSEALGGWIALGFLEGGESAWRDTLLLAEAPNGAITPVRAAPPNMLDPRGDRQRPERDPRAPETSETPRPAPQQLLQRTALGGLIADPSDRRRHEARDGVALIEAEPARVIDLVAWPDAFLQTEKWLVDALELDGPLDPGRSSVAAAGIRVMRIGPLSWRIIADADRPGPALNIPAKIGVSTDVSHMTARLDLRGSQGADVLARLMRHDLRDASFPVGSASLTPLGGAPTLLMRPGAHEYSLWPRRSAAIWAWERLRNAIDRLPELN